MAGDLLLERLGRVRAQLEDICRSDGGLEKQGGLQIRLQLVLDRLQRYAEQGAEKDDPVVTAACVRAEGLLAEWQSITHSGMSNGTEIRAKAGSRGEWEIVSGPRCCVYEVHETRERPLVFFDAHHTHETCRNMAYAYAVARGFRIKVRR